MNGKAAKGEGSLYREREGMWRATYRLPGELRARRVRGRTRDEALRRHDEAIAKALEAAALTPSGAVLSGSTTIGQFCQWWLRNVAALRVPTSSLGKYEDRVARIAGALGEVPLRELRAEQVATWQTQLLATLGPPTVSDTRSLLWTIIEEAVTLELVANNLVTKVRPPRTPRAKRRALNPDEARALVAAAARDRLRPRWRCCSSRAGGYPRSSGSPGGISGWSSATSTSPPNPFRSSGMCLRLGVVPDGVVDRQVHQHEGRLSPPSIQSGA